MGKKLARILSTALLVPVLVFAVAGTSWAAWRCQYDGIARSKCCCPTPTPTGAEQGAIKASGCCEIERTAVEKAPSDLSRTQVSLDPVLVAVPTGSILFVDLSPPARTRFFIAEERPPDRRVLILQKQSFLI